MKKLTLILAALLVATALLVSCSSKDNTETNVTPDEPIENVEQTVTLYTAEELQTIVDGIYEKHPVPFMAGTIPAELVNADSYTYYTGLTDDSKIHSLLVSESMMGAQAYSLVLASVKEGEDVKAVADAMINGIDQRKWVCVEADLIRTVTSGNTVMLVMINSEMGIEIDGFVTAFEELVGAVEYEAQKN